MATTTKTTSSSISTLGLLGIVFITLKLCGVINWSWWWVTVPFWGGLGLVVSVLCIAGLLYGVASLIERKQ